MRTTLTLDPDVELLLRKATAERNVSMARLVNDSVRQALGQHSASSSSYAFTTFDCGPSRVDLTKANLLAAALDDEDLALKLSDGR